MKAVIDAGVVLRAFLADEAGQGAAQAVVKAFVLGELDAVVPSVLPYEVSNALLVAVRRERISEEEAVDILARIESLGLPAFPVDQAVALELGLRHGLSAYDASYLALARAEHAVTVTADRKLHRAVAGKVAGVHWLDDWTVESGAIPDEPER